MAIPDTSVTCLVPSVETWSESSTRKSTDAPTSGVPTSFSTVTFGVILSPTSTDAGISETVITGSKSLPIVLVSISTFLLVDGIVYSSIRIY